MIIYISWVLLANNIQCTQHLHYIFWLSTLNIHCIHTVFIQYPHCIYRVYTTVSTLSPHYIYIASTECNKFVGVDGVDAHWFLLVHITAAQGSWYDCTAYNNRPSYIYTSLPLYLWR